MTRQTSGGRRVRFGDLPLFWRLLLPFMSLILIMGFLGTFAIVRNLSDRAQDSLDQDLSRRSVDARTRIHDRELYLLESLNFATNIEGMERAIRSRDAVVAERLLRSVLALKEDVSRLIVTDGAGRGLVEFERQATGSDPRIIAASDLSADPVIAPMLAGRTGARGAGFLRRNGAVELLIAGPICPRAAACVPTGVAVATMRLDTLTAEALGGDRDPRSSVAIFDAGGAMLATAGPAIPAPSGPPGKQGRRTTSGSGRAEIATHYAPFVAGNRVVGTIAVGQPVAPVFQSVRRAGLRLALIVFAGMLAVVVIGVLQSKRILRQVQPLVAASRRLGRGDLATRAQVLGNDELGELARHVNKMAEQLQASYETLESRVSQRTEEIERLLQERSDFFAAMSHEFRTPIAVILSQSEMLGDARESPTPEFVDDTSRNIRRSGEQLLGLVNEILDLAQSEAGGIDVEIEDLALRQIIDDLRPTIDGLAASSDLTVRYDVPRDLPRLLGDRDRVRQVLLNLVDNAAKYTPAGGVITISARADDDEVAILVADTGVGIPEGTGDVIFEPFYRVKANRPQRDRASSGLGLALAKRFVLAQSGRIDYVSSPGKGSTFTVFLPALPAEQSRKRSRARS